MFIGNKKCRIYAAFGVSQTPSFNENIRGDFFGIKWYSKGDEYWQGANKSDENGCVGCPWYDLADWKKKFNEHLSQE